MSLLYTKPKIGIILGLFLYFIAYPVVLMSQEAEEVEVVELGPAIRVIDDYGNPIHGAIMKNSMGDSVASSSGAGLISLPDRADDVLVFEHPGFNTIRTRISWSTTDANVITVSMTEKINHTSGKMNVLYGKADPDLYLGASATAYTGQLNTTLANTYLHALPGRLTGLYVEQYAGMRDPNITSNANQDLIGSIPVVGLSAPSDNQQFNLSVRGQLPVTIIDGIQRDLYSIDPDNIESISIQKDAMSSILLGMRSSRGVLLVTTKKAKDEGFRLSFTGQRGVQTLLKVPEPLPAHQYAYLLNEALQYDGKEAAFSADEFLALASGANSAIYPNINWYDRVLKKRAPISSYNLNVSSGGKSARYYVGLSYMNQEGHFRSSSANPYATNLSSERYLITSNIDVDVTDDFTVSGTLFGRIEEGVQPGAGAFNILNDVFATPNIAYPVYNPDGSYGGTNSFTRNLMAQTVNSGYIQNSSRDAMVNLRLNYDFNRFVKGLSFSAVSNISTQSQSAIVRNKRNIVYEFVADSLVEGGGNYSTFGFNRPQSNSFVSVSNYKYWYGQLKADYDRNFGKHGLSAMLFADKQVMTINYDLPRQPYNLAAKAKYNFAGKYIAEGAIIRSTYNGYRPGHQSDIFYAFGLGWDLARENFMKSATWLDQFKIRSIYGRTGNGIDNAGYYSWRQSYDQSVTDYTYLQGYSTSNQTGTYESSPMANPNISWEKADKVNVGLDFAAFNHRIKGSVDYYVDNYFDLLQVRGKTIALGGFDYPVENIGKSRYKGLEAAITFQDNIGNFNYFVTANWSRNSSEVIFMDEQRVDEEYRRRTGKPVGANFGYVADGFFTSVAEIESSPVIEGFDIKPGDLKYKDLNGDGVVDQFDHTAIGGLKPLSFYGATLGFNFKGIDFSVLIQGAYNRDIYVGNSVLQAGFQGYGQSYGQAYSHMLNRWTPETAETAEYPRLTAGGNSYNLNPGFIWSSFWMKSGDYLRVKNVSIGYTILPAVSRRFIDAQVRIFANATNLLTFSKYTLVDPEVIDFTSYPIQRVISGGITIKL